jgi:hypothetical protein
VAEDLRFAAEEPRGREAAFDAAPLSVIWPLLGEHRGVPPPRDLVQRQGALLPSQSAY